MSSWLEQAKKATKRFSEMMYLPSEDLKDVERELAVEDCCKNAADVPTDHSDAEEGKLVDSQSNLKQVAADSAKDAIEAAKKLASQFCQLSNSLH